jgi:hypothetical protein
VGAKIKDGKYSIDRVPPGRYVVVIQGMAVPDKFGSEDMSPLTAEVGEDGATFDFDLTS